MGVRVTMMFRMARAAVALGALSVTIAAASQTAPKQYTVVMANMNYGALPGGAKVGDTIVWINRDSVPHTVTARDHSFDLRVAPGQSGRMTLQKAGTIPFYCIFHSMMRGTLKVAAK
jgi:plastocyanin